MGLDQIINSLILDIFPFMPSSGAWPFTMISISKDQLLGIKADKKLTAAFQLLVLKRTDYDIADLYDYARKSKEYDTIEDQAQSTFMENYNKIFGDERAFQQWADRTTSLAIGLILHKAISKGIQFSPIETNLAALDGKLGLSQKKLSAFQLFDAYQIDPSFLV